MNKEKEKTITIDEKAEKELEKRILQSMLRTILNNDLIDRDIFNKVMSDINRA
ncbi:MAG: hypothetical protein M0Q14_01245 [Tissierellaceae bacterium]|nr:hypothetical protein [Tissierellaceae bacterium]